MGVDYYSCNFCGETFPDCGHYVNCECGYNWCSEECAEADGYIYKEWEEDGEEKESYSCNFCREEDFESSELLQFALEKLNLTREDLVDEFKKSKQDTNSSEDFTSEK